VLPDLENISIAVGISLLSCVPAEVHVISYALPVTGRHLWFLTHNDTRQCLDKSSRVARPRKHRYRKWNFVAIMCTSWATRYFVCTSGYSRPFKCFRFPVRHYDYRLNSHRIVHRAMLLSAAMTSASSKTNIQQRWICFQRWFTPVDSMVTKFVKFSPKNHPHRLHFRWRNSKTGWTISKISSSFHQALMALGIRRSAIENSDGQLRYSRKTKEGATLHPPRCSRVNYGRHICFIE